ncbi:MAG: hypothetical protein IJK98_02465 [Clostridia bacterium]|nr:hypothetical protein [Clostridia bacterium]
MKQKLTAAAALLLVVCTVVTAASCGLLAKPGPEVGCWRAEINVKELDLSEEDQFLLSLLVGKTACEIDVCFAENGTFSYVMAMDPFKDGLRQSASAIIGLLVGVNLDVFVDRIMGMALDAADVGDSKCAGAYTVDANGLITAMGSETMYFTVNGGMLCQLDENGDPVLLFTKSGQ